MSVLTPRFPGPDRRRPIARCGLALIAVVALLAFVRAFAAQEASVPASAALDALKREAQAPFLAFQQEMDAQIESLADVAVDFAHWDLTYSFATGRRERFPGEGLLGLALSRLDIQRILVLDRRYRARLSLSIESSPLQQTPIPADPGLVELVGQAASEGEISGREHTLGGLMLLDGEISRVVVRPVLRDRGGSVAGGWLVFTQSLDAQSPEALQRLFGSTARSLSAEALSQEKLPDAVRAWLAAAPSEPVMSLVDGGLLQTWFVMRDIDARPLWAMHLTTAIPDALRHVSSTVAPAPAASQERGDGWRVLIVVLAACGLLAAWFWGVRRRSSTPQPVPRAGQSASAVPPMAPRPEASVVTRTASPSPAPALLRVSASHLAVMYQPIVDLDTGQVCALEALPLRTDPQTGWIGPDAPLAVFDGQGREISVARFVLETVRRDMHQWPTQGAAPIPVNINVGSALDDFHDVQDERIQLEVAEDALLDRQTLAFRKDVLARWHATGLRVVVDRYGQWSSVLLEPDLDGVDALKLDARLTRDVATDLIDSRTARAIIDQANRRGIVVIAEGVDRWAQLTALRTLGCRQAQGALFAHPVVAAEVARFLQGECFDVTQHDRLSETDELPTLRLLER